MTPAGGSGVTLPSSFEDVDTSDTPDAGPVGLGKAAASAATPDDIPASCQGFTFDDSTQTPHDWDGDGSDDEPGSWEHLSACLGEYAAAHLAGVLSLGTLLLFADDISLAPDAESLPTSALTFDATFIDSQFGGRHLDVIIEVVQNGVGHTGSVGSGRDVVRRCTRRTARAPCTRCCAPSASRNAMPDTRKPQYVAARSGLLLKLNIASSA